MISRRSVYAIAIALLVVATALYLLFPRTATLVIMTETVEGEIYVDGRFVGTGLAQVVLSLGVHTVSFGDVPDYSSPQPKTIDLTEDGMTVTGTYVRQTGVLVIENMTPLNVPGVTAGLIALHYGKLYLNGTEIGEGQLCMTLETGRYLVECGDVPGFIAPAPELVIVTNGSSQIVTAIYVPKFQNISVSMAKQLMEMDSSLQIIDVRGPTEYKMGHLEGAINIPYGMLEQRMAELDKERDILVYCASGMASILSAGILVEAGFNVYHMDGGVIDWFDAQYPLVEEG